MEKRLNRQAFYRGEILEEEMSDFKIYPNPASTQITIDINEPIEKVSVFNIAGELVQTANTGSFSIETLSKGVYMITIKTKSGISHSRFIKE